MVSALALAGAATIGALFALEGGETVAPSGYSRATLGVFAPAAVGQPPAGVSDGTPAAAPVNTPVAAAPTAAPSPAGSQIPDLKTVPAAPMGPDVTRIANQPPSATASGEAAQATDAAKPPIGPAPKVAGETGAIAQRPTSKLDLPTILSGKSSDHVVVARTRTTSRRARKPKRRRHPYDPPGDVKRRSAVSERRAMIAPSVSVRLVQGMLRLGRGRRLLLALWLAM